MNLRQVSDEKKASKPNSHDSVLNVLLLSYPQPHSITLLPDRNVYINRTACLELSSFAIFFPDHV